MEQDKKPLLQVKNLHVHYVTDEEECFAVNGITFDLDEGDSIGLVGETGAGKTTTAMAIMQLVPDPPGVITEGEIWFQGKTLITNTEFENQKIRGNGISMIFQDPMTALNPIMRVGSQIAEVIALHEKCSKAEAEKKAQAMLEMVGIPGSRFREYPHQFSGGMKQRVVIAMALACNPTLLLADEPTTALDVTSQAQVLDMIRDLRRPLGTSMIMITHDLGIVAEVCDTVAVIYAGEVVEYGTREQIFDNPLFPYTIGLFGSLPDLKSDAKRLSPIEGLPPDPSDLPRGCAFHPRCPHACEACEKAHLPLTDVGGGHLCRCNRLDAIAAEGKKKEARA